MVEARLAKARQQATKRNESARFDISGAANPSFLPTGQLPAELAAEFEVAARAKANLAGALGSDPIPDGTGLTLGIPRLSTGVTTTVMATEGASVSRRTRLTRCKRPRFATSPARPT